MNMFEKQFELRYFEMNNYGEASPLTMLTLLEETASDHCSIIDHSLYDLEKKDVGWVLLSGIMVMDRYPMYKEKITVRTWLSDYSAVRGVRENLIYDEHRNVIGRSKGLWVFFDIKRRRPVQIFDDIKEKWPYYAQQCINHDITIKIKAIDCARFVKEFYVCRYDIDLNKHANNIRYLQWMMESVPDIVVDNYILYAVDGRFTGEAKYGDRLVSLTKWDKRENAFIHTIIVHGTNYVCATARTLWKERRSQERIDNPAYKPPNTSAIRMNLF